MADSCGDGFCIGMIMAQLHGAAFGGGLPIGVILGDGGGIGLVDFPGCAVPLFT